MIVRAFIQQQDRRKLRNEEYLVVQELERRGMPIFFYTTKQILRRQLPLDRQSLVVGDLDCIRGALHQLDIPLPQLNEYPVSLEAFLHRRIWRSSLGNLENSLLSGMTRSVFAKPANRCKRFTGFVLDDEGDLYRVGNVSRREQIFCAEVVSWLSEYRIYVVKSQVISVDFYSGNPEVTIDDSVVDKAIDILGRSKESYAGYAIDFGVLSSGETALIEMNDGFALGAYQIKSQDYTNLILSRWEELLSSSNR
jgi:ATP-grasp domain, R2K clade family 2